MTGQQRSAIRKPVLAPQPPTAHRLAEDWTSPLVVRVLPLAVRTMERPSVSSSGRWRFRVSARTPTVPNVACRGFPQDVQKYGWIIRVSSEQLPSRCLPVHHSQITPQHKLRMRAKSNLERQRFTVEHLKMKWCNSYWNRQNSHPRPFWCLQPTHGPSEHQRCNKE